MAKTLITVEVKNGVVTNVKANVPAVYVVLDHDAPDDPPVECAAAGYPESAVRLWKTLAKERRKNETNIQSRPRRRRTKSPKRI